jgi:hypothetical protein
MDVLGEDEGDVHHGMRIPIIICHSFSGRRTSTENPLGLMKNTLRVYIFVNALPRERVSAGRVAAVRLCDQWFETSPEACRLCFFCRNPRCRLKFFVPIVRVSRYAPIVRVAHGWGGGVEA